MERIRGGLSRGCQQRAGRRRELRKRVSEMTCALNSLYGVEHFPLAQHASPAQDEARHVLHRAAEAFTPRVTRVSPQDGSSTAHYRADLLPLPDSSVRASPVQDLVRCEDSEYLVGFREKILLSSEEFRETVASEGHARVHVDPASSGPVCTNVSSGGWCHWVW